MYPWAPAVRLGIAFCHYKLGHLEKAKQAFNRALQASHYCLEFASSKLILYAALNLDWLDVDLSLCFDKFYTQLDPDNVEALVALGISDLQTNEG